MKYIIMFLIVLGLAFADFVTGYIKAKCKNRVSSKALRIGGLHKIAELVIMATAIGLTVGLDMLGKYYDNQQLTNIAGMFTAFSIFGYISVMEIVLRSGEFRRDRAASKMGAEDFEPHE